MTTTSADLCRQAAQAIDHPGIDAVHAEYVAEDGACYLELTLRPEWLAQRRAELAAGGVDRALRRAAMLFDLTYAKSDATFAGWNSSFTQAPLPEAEMEEWVEQTLIRLRPLAGGRVVEVGCGTGLLAKPLSAIATSYLGFDPAPHAVKDLARWAADKGRDGILTAIEGDARYLERLDSGSADLIVINSVAQYFPSIDYLHAILAQCARVLAPGGTLFLGDIRNLDLLDDFHLRRIRASHPEPMSPARTRHRVSRSRSQDAELCLSPSFLTSLPGWTSEIAGKRGTYPNEMNLYRYDALLRPGEGDATDDAMATPAPLLVEGILRDTLATGRADLDALRPSPPRPRKAPSRDGIDSTIETALLREIETIVSPLAPISFQVALAL